MILQKQSTLPFNSSKSRCRTVLRLAQLAAFAACSCLPAPSPANAAETPVNAATPLPSANETPKDAEDAGVKINDFFSVDGYAAVSGTLSKTKGEHYQGTLFNSESDFLDAVKMGLNFNHEATSATLSFFYVPGHNSGCDAGVLDAFASWKKEFGKEHSLTLTAGKFTSYLGFEGFHPIERDFLTYALVAGVPGYHTGIKADYENGPFTIGVAVLDSLQQAGGFYQGDGNLREIGFELCASATVLDDKLQIFAGIGYDTDDKTRSEHGLPGREFEAANNLFLDLFATCKLTERLTLAAEIAHAQNVADISWLAQATWVFTDALSLTGRVSGAKFKDGSQGVQLGVAPQWQPFRHILLRAELSYSHISGGVQCWFGGAQAMFQF